MLFLIKIHYPHWRGTHWPYRQPQRGALGVMASEHLYGLMMSMMTKVVMMSMMTEVTVVMLIAGDWRYGKDYARENPNQLLARDM